MQILYSAIPIRSSQRSLLVLNLEYDRQHQPLEDIYDLALKYIIITHVFKSAPVELQAWLNLS